MAECGLFPARMQGASRFPPEFEGLEDAENQGMAVRQIEGCAPGVTMFSVVSHPEISKQGVSFQFDLIRDPVTGVIVRAEGVHVNKPRENTERGGDHLEWTVVDTQGFTVLVGFAQDNLTADGYTGRLWQKAIVAGRAQCVQIASTKGLSLDWSAGPDVVAQQVHQAAALEHGLRDIFNKRYGPFVIRDINDVLNASRVASWNSLTGRYPLFRVAVESLAQSCFAAYSDRISCLNPFLNKYDLNPMYYCNGPFCITVVVLSKASPYQYCIGSLISTADLLSCVDADAVIAELEERAFFKNRKRHDLPCDVLSGDFPIGSGNTVFIPNVGAIPNVDANAPYDELIGAMNLDPLARHIALMRKSGVLYTVLNSSLIDYFTFYNWGQVRLRHPLSKGVTHLFSEGNGGSRVEHALAVATDGILNTRELKRRAIDFESCGPLIRRALTEGFGSTMAGIQKGRPVADDLVFYMMGIRSSGVPPIHEELRED